jgi:hypothetical protein
MTNVTVTAAPAESIESNIESLVSRILVDYLETLIRSRELTSSRRTRCTPAEDQLTTLTARNQIWRQRGQLLAGLLELALGV